MRRMVGGEPPDRHVEVEQERAPRIIANETLRPEERSDARAARDRTLLLKYCA
jgi:hypothetical protein